MSYKTDMGRLIRHLLNCTLIIARLASFLWAYKKNRINGISHLDSITYNNFNDKLHGDLLV